jgi:hypothetical protein
MRKPKSHANHPNHLIASSQQAPLFTKADIKYDSGNPSVSVGALPAFQILWRKIAGILFFFYRLLPWLVRLLRLTSRVQRWLGDSDETFRKNRLRT